MKPREFPLPSGRKVTLRPALGTDELLAWRRAQEDRDVNFDQDVVGRCLLDIGSTPFPDSSLGYERLFSLTRKDELALRILHARWNAPTKAELKAFRKSQETTMTSLPGQACPTKVVSFVLPSGIKGRMNPGSPAQDKAIRNAFLGKTKAEADRFSTIAEITMNVVLANSGTVPGISPHSEGAGNSGPSPLNSPALPTMNYEQLLALESKDLACLINLYGDINLLSAAELEEYDSFFEPASS